MFKSRTNQSGESLPWYDRRIVGRDLSFLLQTHHRHDSENLNSFSEAIAPWEIASKLHCFSQAPIGRYKKDRSFYFLPAEYTLKA
jgi:hypothetical protein